MEYRTVSLDLVTPELIRSSNIIEAIDRENKYFQKVHGFRAVARAQFNEDNKPPQLQKLEVIIDSKNPSHVLSLIQKIELEKKYLAPEVMALREQAIKNSES